MADVEEVLNAREAAAYLRINEQTIRRLARDSQIPAFKVGGSWRFNRAWLDRWAESQQNSRRRSHILIVDDDEIVRDVVRRALEAGGFDVTTASGGAEALEILTQDPPDLVFLDLQMPDMDGPTTLSGIRRQHPELPVVILTGHPDSELMSQALQYSPITLLSKPATEEQIVGTARSVLGLGESGGAEAGSASP